MSELTSGFRIVIIIVTLANNSSLNSGALCEIQIQNCNIYTILLM